MLNKDNFVFNNERLSSSSELPQSPALVFHHGSATQPRTPLEETAYTLRVSSKSFSARRWMLRREEIEYEIQVWTAWRAVRNDALGTISLSSNGYRKRCFVLFRVSTEAGADNLRIRYHAPIVIPCKPSPLSLYLGLLSRVHRFPSRGSLQML